VFSATSYSWDTHEATTEWKLLNVASGKLSTLPSGWGDFVSELVWVGATKTSVLYVNGSNDDVPGGVTLWTADLGASTIKR
jgi:hypothetical protein